MLVELGLVEQRYKAVCEVLDGATVVDVARRNGVARQTVHDWLRAYAHQGLGGLADRSSRPATCPHQMPAAVEARILELRRAHPAWGPRRILHQLGLEGVDPLPVARRCIGLSSATVWSTPSAAGAGARTTSAGSAPGPWSCGRWTWWGASIWPTEPSCMP